MFTTNELEEGPMNAQDSRLNNQPCGAGHRGATVGSKLDDRELLGAAQTDACVLFTGKEDAVEALAQRIHSLSGWRHGPFLSVDCAWSEATLESRLFGSLLNDDLMPETPQPQARLSQEGTLFLQEVGRLSPASQARLADHLAELRTQGGARRVRRRVMASSSETLVDRVNAGTFDAQLFYRLNVIHLILPADQGNRDQGNS
jgi:DNA-binding NtrC family response regulator